MMPLFTTIIGSHVWKMNTPKSDIDEATIYIASTKNILNGKGIQKTTFQTGPIDRTNKEIGAVIENLIQCNINDLIIVLSPLNPIYTYKNYQKDLQKIIKNNISKNCFYSISGLGSSNYHKYIINRKGNKATQKRD